LFPLFSIHQHFIKFVDYAPIEKNPTKKEYSALLI